MGISCWFSILITIFLFIPQLIIGKSTCREIELPRDCEALCNTSSTGVVSCELRVVVMLPADPQYEIALPKVLPVLDLAIPHARAQNLLPHWLNLTFLHEDDRCDATYAQRAAIDSYSNCVHLFLGPTCDYCVANVGRVVKFFGAPLITTGGLTFDFTEPKKECNNEYFMTTRVGTVSFREISKIFIKIMNFYDWKKVHLLYATNGQRQVAGRHTCQLMMKSMVEFIKMEPNFTYGNFDFEAIMPEDYLETLKVHIGNSYGVDVRCCGVSLVLVFGSGSNGCVVGGYDDGGVGGGGGGRGGGGTISSTSRGNSDTRGIFRPRQLSVSNAPAFRAHLDSTIKIILFSSISKDAASY
ncbi:hypothetical protein M0802_006093 [Mischocyttarus mexicanus]|nr:hypothetical protein M0802_006093 [Mischocyttarus mexicanus]